MQIGLLQFKANLQQTSKNNKKASNPAVSSPNLSPLSKDTVSFSGTKKAKTKADTEANAKAEAENTFCAPDWGFKKSEFDRNYHRKHTLPDGNSYDVAFGIDIRKQIKEDGTLPESPLSIKFKNPVDIETGLDACAPYIYDCKDCLMHDSEQFNILKEFVQNDPDFKDEKMVSLIDAMNHTVVLELTDGRVLKMVKRPPFVNNRPYEPSFDIPLLSEVKNYKDYYFLIQEKADTRDIETWAVDDVMERIKEAGYKPVDIQDNELQIGWSPSLEEYMLIDSECAT